MSPYAHLRNLRRHPHRRHRLPQRRNRRCDVYGSMKELKINTGVEEYLLAGKVAVSFNPTDMNFLERLSRAFSELDALQEEVRSTKEKSRTTGKCSPSPVSWTARCALFSMISLARKSANPYSAQ